MGKMNTRHLVLIRHSLSLPVPAISSDQWGLSEKGKLRLARLAPYLEDFQCERVYSSPEPKALQTAQFAADHFDVHIDVHDDLREHDRRNEAWLDSQAEFDTKVIQVFRQPDVLVFGSETADQARERFTAAITGIVADGEYDILAATHGTIMTLFISQYNQVDPIEFWSKMGMPAIAILALPAFELISTVECV